MCLPMGLAPGCEFGPAGRAGRHPVCKCCCCLHLLFAITSKSMVVKSQLCCCFLQCARQVSLPAWSAVGAAALLAGNTRLLLTTALIVSETSGCTPVIGVVIVATAIGKAVADAIIPVSSRLHLEQADAGSPQAAWRGILPAAAALHHCMVPAPLDAMDRSACSASALRPCLLPACHVRLSRRYMHGRRSTQGMRCWSPWTRPTQWSCSAPCGPRCAAVYGRALGVAALLMDIAVQNAVSRLGLPRHA